MNLADRLRAARLRKGWSQAKLAEESGVSQQLISKLERGEAQATKEGPALAGALGMSLDELVLGQPPRLAGETRYGEPAGRYEPVPGALPTSVRRIPVLSYVQAGMPREVLDRYAGGEGFATLGLTAEIAAALGPHAFGLRVEGDSMAPDFKAGDYVVVDPDAPVEPGDIVVAKLDREEAATLKKYRSRGEDAAGHPVFELVPLNDDYPTLTVDATNPGRLVAPVIEHRRKLRRR